MRVHYEYGWPLPKIENDEDIMPLKIRLKPEAKMLVEGSGYIINGGTRPIDLLIIDLKVDRIRRLEKEQKAIIEDLDL